MKPTIVLVQGAFAESSSWNDVIDSLQSAGHSVIAAANPLRTLAGDAASVADLIRTLEGPVLLVAHSYGGAVISNVPADAGEITGLVYVCGFAPDAGESCNALAGRFPGSTLGDTLRPVPPSDGTTDLYIRQDGFHEQFCADVPEQLAARMAATQRPATGEALNELSGERPLWRELPSCFLIGEEDRNIPAEAQRFMVERRRTTNGRDPGRVPRDRRISATGYSGLDLGGRGVAGSRLTAPHGGAEMDTSYSLTYPVRPMASPPHTRSRRATTCSILNSTLTPFNSLASRPERTTHEH
jgi:pimeloyl-ACP methyl ester carboxylesterase